MCYGFPLQKGLPLQELSERGLKACLDTINYNALEIFATFLSKAPFLTYLGAVRVAGFAWKAVHPGTAIHTRAAQSIVRRVTNLRRCRHLQGVILRDDNKKSDTCPSSQRP